MRYDRKLLNIDLSFDSCLATSERFQELFTALKNAQGLSYNVNRTDDYHHFVLADHSHDAGALPGALYRGLKQHLYIHVRCRLLDLLSGGGTGALGMGQKHMVCQREEYLGHLRDGFVAHGA